MIYQLSFNVQFPEQASTKVLFPPLPQRRQQQQRLRPEELRQEEPRQDDQRQEEHEKRTRPKLSVGIYLITYILSASLEIVNSFSSLLKH